MVRIDPHLTTRLRLVFMCLAIMAGCAAQPTSDTASPTAPPKTANLNSDQAKSGSGSTAVLGGTTPAPANFTGSLEDFYKVPAPMPAGEPGELIRVQPFAVAAEPDAISIRVMYHSRDVQNHDRAVTGVITYPTKPAPAGGWPVVAWAHGTTGLTSICAPSRNAGSAPSFGITAVRVATDYIGLGPIGERHAYLSGASEGHSVIDSVRAARRLPNANAGTRWVAIGHSQGGHSALFTNELGKSYAPELDLLGTVVVAPAAVLDRTFGPADQIVPRMVGIMAFYGIATDHPDLKPDDYVGDEVKAKAAVIDQKCTDEIVNRMVFIAPATFYKRDPLTTEPARSILLANDPGHVKVDAPMLLVYATADSWVVPDRALYLYKQLCGIHQVVQLAKIDGATHGSVVTQAGSVITGWFQDRLAAKAAPSTCEVK